MLSQVKSVECAKAPFRHFFKSEVASARHLKLSFASVFGLALFLSCMECLPGWMSLAFLDFHERRFFLCPPHSYAPLFSKNNRSLSRRIQISRKLTENETLEREARKTEREREGEGLREREKKRRFQNTVVVHKMESLQQLCSS